MDRFKKGSIAILAAIVSAILVWFLSVEKLHLSEGLSALIASIAFVLIGLLTDMVLRSFFILLFLVGSTVGYSQNDGEKPSSTSDRSRIQLSQQARKSQSPKQILMTDANRLIKYWDTTSFKYELNLGTVDSISPNGYIYDYRGNLIGQINLGQSNTDTRFANLRFVNDSLAIDSVNALTGAVLGTAYLDNAKVIDTDTRTNLSIVNDSLKVDLVDVKTGNIISTNYIDNVINQNIIVPPDTRDSLSFVNDSLKIEVWDKKNNILITTYYVDDVINKPDIIQSATNDLRVDGTNIVRGSDDPSSAKGSQFTSSIYNHMNGFDDYWIGGSYSSGVLSLKQDGYILSKGRDLSEISSKWGGFAYNNNTGSMIFGWHPISYINNTLNNYANLTLGDNNNITGTHVLTQGTNNTLSTQYDGGAYVNGLNCTGIGGHGSILSGQECTGSFRSWMGGYLNKDLNSLWDNYVHGYGNTFSNTGTSFAHAKQVIMTNDNNCSALSSDQSVITNSNSSGVLGGQVSVLTGTNSSFIVGGDQGQEISNVNLSGSQLFSSVIVGGQFNKSFHSFQIIGGRANVGSSNSPKSIIFGSDNRALYGIEQCLYGNGLKGNNARTTATGNYNIEWTQGEFDVHNQNDLNWVIGCGYDETSRFNAMTMLKNGWVNFNPTAPTTSGVVQSQVSATPQAPFHVDVVNQSGNVFGGVLLAPINNTQLLGIPSGNLKDGMGIYCTDCIANDSTVGVKMVYQLSTATWRKLW